MIRNWVLGMIIVLLAGFWQAGHLTYTVMKKKSQWELQGESLAKKYTGIEIIEKISLYHGDQSYIVVEGENPGGAKMVAWFRDGGLFEGFEYVKDLIPVEVIKDNVTNQIPEAEFIRFQPGMDQKTPVWEVVLLDKEGKFNYLYYDMKTGSFIRSYRLQ